MVKASRRKSRRQNKREISEKKTINTSPVKENASVYRYISAIIIAVAVTGARVDIVHWMVPNRYFASWYRFLFVITACSNVRSHTQFINRSWIARLPVYLVCNFAGMSVIQPLKQETLGYMRSITPWLDVAIAAFIVEIVVLLNPAAQSNNLMRLRSLCVFPIAIWKCWSVKNLIEYAIKTDLVWYKLFPMFIADMYAFTIALSIATHIVGTRSLFPSKEFPVSWLGEIAMNVATCIAIGRLWVQPLPSLEWFSSLGYVAILAFNLNKHCSAPLTYFSISRRLKSD
ncbi:hypothetical protein THRCLA_00598 [Thraustotheca clavata]|uniref:Transmembrane protein n=1 Tax=Thraustotheca clavata TaxID=74557 RepID=A0A1W0AB42_9STRA|nr:hypothetical protein THRCLA_00598 [Thraustotheca clavata]